MAYIICWANENDSDWEVVDGEDAMQVRVSELHDGGITTVMTFDEDDELDRK